MRFLTCGMIAGAYLVLGAGRSESAGAFFCSYDGTVVMRLTGVSENECEVVAYRLARKGLHYRWVHRHPADPELESDLRRAVSDPPRPRPTAEPLASPTVAAPDLTGVTLGLVGRHPPGFEPCDYDPDQLRAVTGVEVDPVPIEDWFDSADAVTDDDVTSIRDHLATRMAGLDTVDGESLARSLRLYLGLEHMSRSRSWAGVATRCWPECFTVFGGAACSGNSLLSSAGIPACCEADVYGNVTALLLQRLSGQPPFVADLVDIDRQTNTGAFWH